MGKLKSKQPNDVIEAVSGGYASAQPTKSAEPLFRAEALAAQQELDWGRPIALMPMAWPVLAVLLLATVSVAAGFLATQRYARKEPAIGVLKPIGGEIRLSASRPGVISVLNVAEGAEVAKGAILATIATAQTDHTGANSDEQVLAGLNDAEASLEARLNALEKAQPFELASIQSDIEGAVAQRDAAMQAQIAIQERLKISEDRVAAARTLLDKGLIPAEEMRRREEARLAVAQQLSDAQAQVHMLNARIAGLQAKRAQHPAEVAQTRAVVVGQKAELAQRRPQIEIGRGYDIKAPVAGRITALQATLGQTVDPARPMMTLTPINARLVAELYVPSRAIGFVKPGQTVRLLYEAFPYQRFGPATGVVEATSATVLAPNEVQAMVPLKEPVYRVIVRLDRQFMPAFGKQAPLQAGMALRADIVLEERSFAEWIFEPILAMRGRL